MESLTVLFFHSVLLIPLDDFEDDDEDFSSSDEGEEDLASPGYRETQVTYTIPLAWVGCKLSIKKR